MGRNRRMDYQLIGELYENFYSTVVIGRILDTPNGHVSKVLKRQGVKARKRGEIVKPIPFNELDKGIQAMILSDEYVTYGYRRVMGKNSIEIEEEKEWKDMTLEEKGEKAVGLLENGMTTREAAKIVGVSQSTLVKTKNRFLYGTDTVPKKSKVS